MASDKAKKAKAAAKEGDEQLNFNDSDAIDGQVILSIEKLQEIQDELDKVIISNFSFLLWLSPWWKWWCFALG